MPVWHTTVTLEQETFLLVRRCVTLAVIYRVLRRVPLVVQLMTGLFPLSVAYSPPGPWFLPPSTIVPVVLRTARAE